MGVVCGLIVLQPDFGAAALIAGTSLAMFFLAGADLKQLALSVAGGSGVLVLLVSAWPYAQDRLRSFLNPAGDPLRTGWQIQRILAALRSGGWFGRGLGNGEFKQMLPLPHTDAIFPVIGEELGLIGCMVVIGVFAFIVWRGMIVSLNAPDIFSSLLAAGVSFWIALQALVHVAGNTATLPYTGVTLPFVSYGGSSLIMTLAGVGALLGVSRVTVERPSGASSTFAFRRRYRRARLSRTVRGRGMENRTSR
jgi:cell division protein FtsW